MTDWLPELAQWLRIPSVSADDAHAGDVIRAGEWVRDFVRAAGGQAEVVDWKGQPLVIGEIRANASGTGPEAGTRAPSVLCYGHFDVQPPDPLELWDSPPFEPEVRDGYLYGRGVADDKGQLYLLLAAARDLAAAGELPVTVRFALDGEEETGGHSIVEWVEQDSGPADAAIIFDTGMIARDRPAFNVATRGVQYFHVTLRTGRSDLHSGMFGGAAMNAAHALIRTLDQLVAVDGRLVESLRAGVQAPTDTELSDWRALPPGASELSDQGATPADPAAADEFYLRTFAEPSLDVNGIDSGSPYLQKTVIPIRADANVSVRIVAGQRGEEIVDAFGRLVREAAPAGASVEVSLLSGAEPGVVPPDSPAIQLGLDAFESALGVRPLLIRSGGTLPIVAALSERDIPTIITGFSLPDAQIHAPNERLPADYVPQGIAAARALFVALGEL